MYRIVQSVICRLFAYRLIASCNIENQQRNSVHRV